MSSFSTAGYNSANLAVLQNIKTQLLLRLQDLETNPKPNYTEDGRTVSWDDLRNKLVQEVNVITNLILRENSPNTLPQSVRFKPAFPRPGAFALRGLVPWEAVRMTIYDDFLADIPNDYQVLDGQFSATYTQGGTTITVAGVTRQKLSLEELQMLGGAIGMEPTLRAFSLPCPSLGELVPLNGDRLVDDQDVAWIVKHVDETSFNTRFVVFCQKAQ